MTEAVALSAAQRRLSLLIAMICISAVSTTMGLTWPLLSLILDSRGVSGGLIGISAASQSLAIFAVAPLAPRIVATFGVRRIALGAIASATVMLALLPLTIDPYSWMPIRFLLGASVSLLFIAGQTWVNQTAIDGSRGLVGGVLGFLWSTGFAIGPVIITIAGIDGWRPFLYGIALVLVAAIPLLLAGNLAPAISADNTRRSFWSLIRTGGIALLAAPVLGLADSINDSFLSLYGLRAGFSQQSALLLLATLLIGTTIGHLPIGWLADRIEHRTVLIATVIVTLLLTLAMMMVMPISWLVWPVVFLWGAGLGGVWTVAFVMIGDRFRGAELAAATTLSSMLSGAGSTLGPIIAGHAMGLWRPVAMLVVIAVALTAYLGVCLWLKASGTKRIRR